MSRISYCRILVVASLIVLTAVPMASARTVESLSVSRAQAGDWFGAALRWVEDLISLRRPGHRSAAQTPPDTKAENSTSAAGCLDPAGKPWCYM